MTDDPVDWARTMVTCWPGHDAPTYQHANYAYECFSIARRIVADAEADALHAKQEPRTEPAGAGAGRPDQPNESGVALPSAGLTGWRCFHCDEVFTTPSEAAVHFGRSEMADPACSFDAAYVRGLEERLRRWGEEDTDLHRLVARMESDHQQALIREEEAGYAKGLADGRALASPQVSEPTKLPRWESAQALWPESSQDMGPQVSEPAEGPSLADLIARAQGHDGRIRSEPAEAQLVTDEPTTAQSRFVRVEVRSEPAEGTEGRNGEGSSGQHASAPSGGGSSKGGA